MQFRSKSRTLTARPLLVAVALIALSHPLPAQQAEPERIFYYVDRPDAFDSFLRNLRHISVIAPQSYSVDADGEVKGSVDVRVLDNARANGVRVMPLIVNPNWNRELIHGVLVEPAARARLINRLVELGVRNRFWGWQYDFENVAPADRDALTRLMRETATALRAKGMKLSIAVPVPHHDTAATAYDVKALADAGDFISVMTYDQHTADTPPGPVAGVPWMEHTVRQMLAAGVHPQKLSLGIPFFSMHWFTVLAQDGTRKASARGLSYARADSVLRRLEARLAWDDLQKTHHVSWENRGALEHLYVEDARSFQAKTDLVSKHRLRGFSVWRIGQEDANIWSSLGGSGGLAITHVNLVDVVRGTLARDMTVLIKDSVVAAVGPSRDIAVPKAAIVVEARGKYLMPGLFDMHTHVSEDTELQQMVDAGVTGARDMGGNVAELQRQRQRITNGLLNGPRLYIVGPVLAGNASDNSWAVLTPEDAVRAVDSLLALRVDFVKVHEGIPRDAYHAIVRRAKEHGLPVLGHVPVALTPAEVSNAGQKSIEHLEFVPDYCLVIFDVARRAARTPPPSGCTPAVFDSLFALFARNGTYLTPTIGSFRIWVKPDHFAAIFDGFRELIPLIRKHRIRILAGTDNGNRGITPGQSLHEELELLVKAGFSRLEALQAATVNAWTFLGDEAGGVAPGMVANLMMTANNPLRSELRVLSPEVVVVRGRVLRSK